jgi:hypothetical protein
MPAPRLIVVLLVVLLGACAVCSEYVIDPSWPAEPSKLLPGAFFTGTSHWLFQQIRLCS